MGIRTQILLVVIDAQMMRRQHVYRGHYIEEHITSIALLFSWSIMQPGQPGCTIHISLYAKEEILTREVVSIYSSIQFYAIG